MGTDIHCYIEYRSKDPKSDSYKHWHNFGKEFRCQRNYGLFGLLAGVRCSGVMFYPRGIVLDMVHEAFSDCFFYVNDKYQEHQWAVSLAKAKEWKEKGYATIEVDGKITRVQNPDYHHHSWLNTQEYEKVLNSYQNRIDTDVRLSPEYLAILAAMKNLENQGMESRLVFWFDN